MYICRSHGLNLTTSLITSFCKYLGFFFFLLIDYTQPSGVELPSSRKRYKSSTTIRTIDIRNREHCHEWRPSSFVSDSGTIATENVGVHDLKRQQWRSIRIHVVLVFFFQINEWNWSLSMWFFRRVLMGLFTEVNI